MPLEPGRLLQRATVSIPSNEPAAPEAFTLVLKKWGGRIVTQDRPRRLDATSGKAAVITSAAGARPARYQTIDSPKVRYRLLCFALLAGRLLYSSSSANFARTGSMSGTVSPKSLRSRYCPVKSLTAGK
jgi:hypothetical protein